MSRTEPDPQPRGEGNRREGSPTSPKRPGRHLVDIERALAELVGADYVAAVCRARSALCGEPIEGLQRKAAQKVHFFPADFQRRADELVALVGQRLVPPLKDGSRGAATESFERASQFALAPLGGFGCTRIGEDGRLYLIAKSEHYHASLGHAFPGFDILEVARALGVSNTTHNNTRGHITRLLETRLVSWANGRPGAEELERILAARSPTVLNRVINLETGSLAVEAAVKMMLARFYRLDGTREAPPYAGRVPVFLVLGDEEGGRGANYHGTTIVTQLMRDLWPELLERAASQEILRVEPVAINDAASFQETAKTFERKPYKIAGFLHEIVLMNYGGVLLSPDFLHEAYATCARHDIPTVVDEIQSCAWSPELFLFREYELSPSFVAMGKGLPGGMSPASRILASAPMDNLDQFGALVTNGQEELASLSYLVTMAFIESNGQGVRAIGDYYAERLGVLARRFPRLIRKIEGVRHLSSIFFHTHEQVNEFVERLHEACIDVSVQAYKAKSPSAALTKLPLIATERVVDFLLERMESALRAM